MVKGRDAVGPLGGCVQRVGTDQILAVGGHVGADAVRFAVLPEQRVIHMGDVQPAADSGRHHLVERLLLRHAAAALDEDAPAVCDLPLFLQPAVGGVAGGDQVKRITAGDLPEQQVAHIVAERIVVEVDLLPLKRCGRRVKPILVGKAQSVAFQQKNGSGHFGVHLEHGGLHRLLEPDAVRGNHAFVKPCA